MSAPVDVLAVIDDFAEDYRTYIPQFHAQNRKRFKRKLSEINEARAAVADLVEAVRNYRDNCARLKADYPGDDPFPRAELDRHQFLKGQMFAALARFGGAA